MYIHLHIHTYIYIHIQVVGACGMLTSMLMVMDRIRVTTPVTASGRDGDSMDTRAVLWLVYCPHSKLTLMGFPFSA
jgi:hypothetical protein